MKICLVLFDIFGCSGNRIPDIQYTAAETATWSAVWNALVPRLQKHACLEYVIHPKRNPP